jgi:methionyl-tRNA formyltransferase
VWDATLAPEESRLAGAAELPGTVVAASDAGTSAPDAAAPPGKGVAASDAGAPAAGAAELPGTVIAASDAGIDVACGRGVLRILRLQLAGRKPLAAGEFIKAHRLTGARFPNT